jgi:putative Holliday junction resolvase
MVTTSGRILALDVGEKTLGVAVSDPLRMIAQPVSTIRRRGIRSDLRAIMELVESHEAVEILVGMPLRLQGDEGPAAESVLSFIEKLRPVLEIPIVKWDERFSTAQAEKILLEADLSRKKRREVIDKVAASIILQSYLDSRGRSGA